MKRGLIGLILFLAGGVMLTLWSGVAGSAVGSTFGLAGVGLMAWAWWRRSDGKE
ncbi:MAG: hypothetical protein HKO59_15325 [Phycisphaerales bacterium]|nr:hypothetical protein [Phycisphaerales bacterium]NNM27331.1 hypothetical protein [Phycisphaerales bacterium]